MPALLVHFVLLLLACGHSTVGRLLTDEQQAAEPSDDQRDVIAATDEGWPRFRLRNSTVLVEHQRRFWTLCADSFRVPIGVEICRQLAGKNSKLKTAARVPLDLPIAVELECAAAGDARCPPARTELTIDCADGMEVECEQRDASKVGEGNEQIKLPAAPDCPPDWFRVSGAQCVGVADEWRRADGEVNLLNFDDSSAICRSIHPDAQLASFSSFTWKQMREMFTKLLPTIPPHLRSFPLLTSAVRAKSEWKWADRVVLPHAPHGNAGRCAAADQRNRTLESVDCNRAAFVPLCQLNVARRCVTADGHYDGEVDRTISGALCLHWNDRAVLRNGLFTPLQRHWDHNWCRNPSGTRGKPWCMISEATFQECDVPFCSNSEQKKTEVGRSEQQASKRYGQECAADEERCGTSDQCVARDFFCDYELDCQNGFDEVGCPDFLRNFETAGEFKLIDEVSAVWTHIANVQSCARRCVENADFRCESFSFDSTKELCSLSRSSNNPAVLFERLDSFYFRRKFSEHHLAATKDPLTNVVRVAKNGSSEAPVCVERLTDATVADGLCAHFGFGQPLFPFRNVNDDEKNPLAAAPLPAVWWPLDCLRDANCSSPATPQPTGRECRRFLRCSDCRADQFACRTSGQCVDAWRVCEGTVDCADATDEIGCSNLRWRLWDGGTTAAVEAAANATDGANGTLAETLQTIGERAADGPAEGRVQIDFQGAWTDVCADGFENGDQVDFLCAKLGHGKSSGRMLPISEQTPTAITWFAHCRAADCRPLRIQRCRRGILNLRCESDRQPLCGRRYAKIRRRTARVVGGFDTLQSSFPWTAALRFRHDDSHHCGAVIIGESFLLSAAHCFEKEKDPSAFYVLTGDWDRRLAEGNEQQFNLSAIHFYPKYEDLFTHDIVVLELAAGQRIRFNDANQPICLPPRGFRYKAGQVCLVSGWGSNGTTYPQKLQAAAMPILETEVCRNASKVYSAVSRTSFCAGYLSGGVDSCQGDSGGPFACEHDGIFYLAGIISWGDGCAQESQPGIYTMLTPYLSWIEGITGVVA
ncbi:hypothetical protein M3Y99_01176500 [Aphelenchoides fujianensis]|nr:hypothetical protein M3Y99_01176500 [Aphelenchoides fujianensis]